MTYNYYEVEIIHTTSSDGDKFYNNGDETMVFETIDDVKKWIDQKYGSEHIMFKDPDYKMKRSIMYNGKNIPCGYVFEFEDADYSHSPVERWVQQDWVSVYKIVSENAFGEIEHEIP